MNENEARNARKDGMTGDMLDGCFDIDSPETFDEYIIQCKQEYFDAWMEYVMEYDDGGITFF